VVNAIGRGRAGEYLNELKLQLIYPNTP